MPLKNKQSGQYPLSIVNAPPPPEAERPMVRKRMGTPGNESEMWVPVIARLVGVDPDGFEWVGPSSAKCGTHHAEPAQDRAYGVHCCPVCGVELEKKYRKK